MATSPTQIRIDTTIKEEANVLFSRLGLDMSSAVNIFLRQCLLRGGLPFSVEVPKYNEETLAAMEDAKRISRDPDIQGYSSINELFKALDEE
ncbi:type II toxin-antitoxin system RelB/DinJ family antitoxin [uncultured Granulicatella sp.]|uniref:type II toxin-antitoxin system RelB/DinJ family antitoxin n=1 Tax=uncultured Granulicatella sp. TaxID=316089 RepID=UPI0028D3439A|nr:type II toxin-antitoxin system RelB/DinJ family antitoxin [uncultured Granulicatella sp.]